MTFNERELEVQNSKLSVSLKRLLKECDVETLGILVCLTPQCLSSNHKSLNTATVAQINSELLQHYGMSLRKREPLAVRLSEVYDDTGKVPVVILKFGRVISDAGFKKIPKKIETLDDITDRDRGAERIGLWLKGKDALALLKFLADCGKSQL